MRLVPHNCNRVANVNDAALNSLCYKLCLILLLVLEYRWMQMHRARISSYVSGHSHRRRPRLQGSSLRSKQGCYRNGYNPCNLARGRARLQGLPPFCGLVIITGDLFILASVRNINLLLTCVGYQYSVERRMMAFLSRRNPTIHLTTDSVRSVL